MEFGSTMKFGEGPRELSGASDLINQYKLLHHYEFFCKKSLPSSISETRYLHNVVGDREIRRGEGMELDQLSRNEPHSREGNASVHHFDLGVLMEAFRMRQTTKIILPSAEKRMFSSMEKSKNECKVEKREFKKYKDKMKEKGHKKNKNHNNIKNKKEERTGIKSGLETLKTHHDKLIRCRLLMQSKKLEMSREFCHQNLGQSPIMSKWWSQLQASLPSKLISVEPSRLEENNSLAGFLRALLNMWCWGQPNTKVPLGDKFVILGDGNLKVILVKEEDIAEFILDGWITPQKQQGSLSFSASYN